MDKQICGYPKWWHYLIGLRVVVIAKVIGDPKQVDGAFVYDIQPITYDQYILWIFKTKHIDYELND